MKTCPLRRRVVVLVSLCFCCLLNAQDNVDRPVYETTRIEGEAPTIDGKLDDPAWDQVDWSSGFHQREPDDSAPASQQTKFKILYDNRYIYVSWRCYDTNPDSIEARLSRRDNFPGDWVEINFDSFNDKQTGFSFTTSVSGVKGDEFISQDGNNWDSSWNPSWFTRTQVDEEGWTAESRIPLSQLRFGTEEVQTWGVQSTRRLFRYGEFDNWSPLKQAQQGWVSRFGTLTGIEGIKPRRPLEIAPYVLGQLNTGEEFDANDPFRQSTESRLNVGLDGRIGITNDVVVDFTINPDFGQVEADPGAINLDGFQIFFQEQRPFFVENRNIFDYQLTQAEAGGSFNSDLLFYSRRIGGRPSRFVGSDPGQNYFVDQPDNSTILGAAKVSGKTQGGLSMGLLSSFTQREFAEIDNNGERLSEEIEPFTVYSVGRVQQDFNQRNSTIGAMLTSVNRNIQTDDLGFLHRNANSGGLDFLHRWKDRAWYLSANMVYSSVAGSEEAILNTQTAFERLFQRPGADHMEVDSSRTSLSGTGGTLRIGELEGKWVFEAGATWRSPGLELNDIGFLINADEINAFAWGARRWQQPFGIFRRLQWNQNLYLRWDFSGVPTYRAYNTNAWMQFKNFWNMAGGITVEQLDVSKNILRGGPLLRRPRGYGGFYNFSTDGRKRFQLNPYFNGGRSYDGVVASASIGIFFNYQVTNALSMSLNNNFSRNKREEQYFTTVTDGSRTEYIVGEIDQQTLSITLRATLNISPDFTVQYYGQPFIAKGIYTDFKKVADPMAVDFADRFHTFGPAEVQYNNDTDEYLVDDDTDRAIDYSFGNPDFNFMQFRSNFVARWEYRPGSELFFVWSQGTTVFGDPQQNVFRSLSDDLFSGNIQNTFLMKATYRWVR
ncbi:MAG: DUF5916 domain-containing protein [Bacteroidota bacterium]